VRRLRPGLVGYGLLAVLVRAGYARGRVRTAAAATVATWLAVAVTDVALVSALPDVDRVVLLGAGHTVGVTLGGWCCSGAGRDGAAGVGRSALAGLAGAASAQVAGG
jgi:putative peptidoglycan lipid II flippase